MEFNAQNFGQILRFLREHEGLSMLSLGKKLGTSASRIKSWENGDSVPSAKWVVLLSSILDVPLDVLLLTPKEEVVHYSDQEWDDIMNGVGPNEVISVKEMLPVKWTKADYLEQLMAIAVDLDRQDLHELYTLAKVKREKS